MFRWYAVNTYSGHEKKVKQNLEHRVQSMGQAGAVKQVVIPTEQVQEMKDGQKITKEQRTMPGYLLVNMNLTDDSWVLVKNTPGVTGFVGASQKPVPLSQGEIDRLLNRETAERPRTRAQFSIGESVKVVSAARCRTSRARSRRSTTTLPSSRCWYPSSAARRRSRSASTR